MHHLLSHLYYFLMVYKHKSCTKVADELHVSPSTITYQIKTLEEKTGVRLLKREGNQRTEFTFRGEMLARECYDIFKNLNDVMSRFVNPKENREIRVTAPLSFGTCILMPALEYVNSYMPGADFNLILTNELVNLNEHDIDIAIRNVEKSENFICEALMRINYVGIASRNYLDQAPSLENFTDVSRHKLIDALLHRPDWARVKQVYPELELPDKKLITYIANNSSIIDGVKAGYGIGLIPEYVASNSNLSEKGIVTVLEQYFNRSNKAIMDTLYICYPAIGARNQMLRKVISLIRKFLVEQNYLLVEALSGA